MRIIAGNLGGRTLQSPKGRRTHPMSERARGAIFNLLGDVSGLTVLDAFAGSGALGLEALSRGAAHVTAIDRDKSAHTAVIQNAKQLDMERHLKAIRAGVGSWSAHNAARQFDLIFCDPPYDKTQPESIRQLVGHLTPQGLLILSWPGKQPLPSLEGVHLVTQKTQGDLQFAVYRRTNGS